MALSLLIVTGVSPHHAAADETRYLAFYTPPVPLPPGAPGDLIRTEPSRLVLEPSGQLGRYVGTGTRIMYHSTDAQGRAVAVTGTYIEPDVPWPGTGPRPLIAYATVPYGMGEQCAPSKLFNQGIHASLDTGLDVMFNIESGWVATLLARGFAIVVADGVGMGVHSPESPQFLNRMAGATALIDAARAAMNLPGTSLAQNGPVAFWGWIAGGHAALSAAELANTYGSDLNVVATYAASAPTDLAEVLAPTDGNVLAGVTGYVLRGIIASYPQLDGPIRSTLTPRGLQMLDNTGRQCLMQTAINYAFRHLDGWFINDIYEAVRAEPLRGLIAAQRIGNVKPNAPVYFEHNRWDSFAPYTSTRATASDWCTQNADVTLWTNEQPPFLNKLDVNSLLAPFVDGERSMAWITDRFNGLPTSSNCSELAP
ncbi:lipase family protein [Mycolicibacterium bacteremicum]|uniref:lipase family protein n=1 Tax=Mycolicibacterium bacteremicum TaxID=564198 RepID=UPI00350E509A